MYPSPLPPHVQANRRIAAEKAVYHALQNQLGNDWTVFYSVAWVAPRRTGEALQDGETDFLIIHPKKGVLLMEVKGGTIAYSGVTGQWTSTDYFNQVHLIDDPFKQATKFKYGLRDKVKSLRGWANEWVNFGHCVLFPDCVWDSCLSLPPNAPPQILLDASHMNGLGARLEAIFTHWDGTDGSLTKGGALTETLTYLLAPSNTLANPLSVQAAQNHAKILELTENQFRLLDLMARNRRVAVAGTAGSGKTLLAIEKARRLAQEGFRVLFACHSTPLAKHLKEARPEIRGEAGFVGTLHGWCKQLASEARVALPSTKNGTPDWNAYPDTLLTALATRPDLKVDALILDEAQDISYEWWVALTESLSDRKDAVLYVFYDNNQKVNSGTSIPTDLELTPFDLSENLRNTHRIHEAASRYYQSDVAVQAQGAFGKTVEKVPYVGQVEFARKLTQHLTQLLITERISPQDIVVLTPRYAERSAVPAILQAAFPNRDIEHDSIDRFKGLERSVVIVAELDERFVALPEDKQNALCYVGFSRPTTHLIIMGEPYVINDL